jgi:Fic family protein
VSTLVKLRWAPNPESGIPRRDQKGCNYEAYVPDDLVGRSFTFDGTTLADVSDAEQAIARLNREARGLADTEAVARLLLRAEAVASSRIEGLQIGGRRLLKAQLQRELADGHADGRATEILNNIEAMSWAVEHLAEEPLITVDGLLAVHERLLAGTSVEQHGGRLRDAQNWIGGSSYNPCTADFVPPPPEEVPRLMRDLCAFCNEFDLSPVAQAAVAHAQLETIHPFVDGNGRIGRALIHVLLRRRGLAPRVVPPISLVLATRAGGYVGGLTAWRYAGAAVGPAAAEGVDRWVSFFAAASVRAVADAERYEQDVREVQDDWRRRVGRVRRDSAVVRLIDALPGAPIVTVRSAARLVGRSEQAVNEAIPTLVEAGVLKQITVGQRGRAFEAPDLLNRFNALERQLASPEGDTFTSPPTRVVPVRPQD